MDDLTVDLEQVSAWFTRLYGDMPERNLINIVRTDRWSGEFIAVGDDVEIASVVLGFDEKEPVGIYHRVTSTHSVPEPGPDGKLRRGDVSLSSMIPGFWADLDVAGPGHKSKGELPETKKDAVRIVTNSSLPEPTLWVDSGGGLYPWWLLDEPYQITEANLAAVARLSEDLHAELQRSARELGMEYAPMADLARVLRVPGTINRKVPGAPTMCRVIKDDGEKFSIKALRDVVPAVTKKTVSPSARNGNPSQVFEELPDGPPCRAMLRKLAKVSKDLRIAETGGRHAAALSAVGALLWLGNVGHAGSREALDELREVFDEIKGQDEQGEGEWPGLVGYVVEKMEVFEDRHCCGEMSFTDAHLAERLVQEELSGLYIWAHATGWMRWAGKVWATISDAAMARVTQKWLLANYKDAVDLMRYADPDNAKAAQDLVDKWRGAMSNNRINGIVALTRGQLEYDPIEMDADPDILVCQNGVIHLPTGELMEHDPARRVSKIAGAPYDPKAVSEDFERVLSAVPVHALDWFQVKVGQAATGYAQIGDDPNVIAKGGGMNGKTTVMDMISNALGSYAVKVPKEVLTGEKSTHEIMTLWGARFALTEELPEGARLNTVRIKELTDTPELQGRYLFKNLVTWKPSHSLFVTTNPLPQVSETTLAVWRRLALLVFPFVYVTEDRELEPHERRADPELRIKVRDRDSEIMTAALAWIIAGARRFYAAGNRLPSLPEQVVTDTREWRKESDVVLSFWDDGHIEPDSTSIVTAEDLYAEFVAWTTLRGNKPPSVKVFGPMFSSHQETLSARVYRDRPRITPAGYSLSRPAGSSGPVPQRPSLWFGIRFAATQQAEAIDPFGVSLSSSPFQDAVS